MFIDPRANRERLAALVSFGIWSMLEISLGVALACLPSMRPLLRLITRRSLKETA